VSPGVPEPSSRKDGDTLAEAEGASQSFRLAGKRYLLLDSPSLIYSHRGQEKLPPITRLEKRRSLEAFHPRHSLECRERGIGGERPSHGSVDFTLEEIAYKGFAGIGVFNNLDGICLD
jgi:hypothetical protein